MSREIPAPNEAQNATPEKSEKLKLELRSLQDHIEKGQFDTLVDALMGKAVEGDEIPEATFDAFVGSLTPEEMTVIQDFLESKTDPRMIELREKLGNIQVGLPETAKAALDGLSATTQKIVTAIDAGMARLTSKEMLGGVAAKFGIKEVGPKQLEFIRSFFFGYAAKFIEGIVASVGKFNPSMDITNMLTSPLELRLMGITNPEEKNAYRALYEKRARESTGAFVAPELGEVRNAKSTPEPTLVTGEKVEATKRTVKITNDTSLDITHAEKKTLVTAAGTNAEVKVAGVETQEVRAVDVSDAQKASISFKLTGDRVVTVDAEKLRDAVKDKKDKLTVSDDTSIELLYQNS